MTASLASHLETYRNSAASDDRQAEFSALLGAIRQAVKNDALEAAADAIAHAADPSLDFTSAQSLARLRGRLRAAGFQRKTRCRVAVLGSFTTDQLTLLIDLFAFASGVELELYEAPFGTFRQEVLDPQSALYAFAPQIVYLATSHRDLAHTPALGATRGDALAAVERELADWQSLWATLHQRLACQVIQNNLDTPPQRTLANHELRHTASPGSFIARVNLAMLDHAPGYVTLHDVDHLAASFGRLAWADPRFFFMAKLPCAPEAQVDYAHSVASLISAQVGMAKKCLVLDLDNTLWGGVIGDDGLGGIQIGQGGAEGEAFTAFQQYALALRQRGVILAVCSKNDEANAREPFEKHRDMVLALGDIACFMANWNDKASNLRAIAQQLNIGLDSLVFADDNPAERALVRQLAPEVAVPELPVDPGGYVQAVARHRYFQTFSLQAEDLQRTDFYRANAERDALLQSSTGDVEQFLTSLSMSGRIEPINAMTIERSSQLINKSNQFNLTTRRYSPAEVLARVDDPAWLTASVTLADRFGDNGLISVVLAEAQGDALVIDTWLMSCRVLKRGVEHHVLNHLAAAARARGLQRLLGRYVPSAKNGMVARHYETLGFTLTDTAADGSTSWARDLGDSFQPFKTFIRETTHG